jgi:outer membrane protein with beta-barrel domain
MRKCITIPTKRSLLWACACLFYLSSQSQTNWGLKGGLNVSTTTGPGYTNSYVGSFNAGVFYEAALDSRFSLLTELLYSSKGNHATGSDILRLKYLSVPILAKFKLAHNLFLVAGPECSYLLSAFETSSGPTIHATNVFRRIDIGLDAGFRYIVARRFGIDLRGIKGLTGIEKSTQYTYYMGTTSVGTVDNKDNPRNLAFQLGLYYILMRPGR